MTDYVLLTRLAATLTLAMLVSRPLLDALGVRDDLAQSRPTTQRLFIVIIGGVAIQALGCAGLTFWYAPELIAAGYAPVFFGHAAHWLYRLAAQIWYSGVWPRRMRRAHYALVVVLLSKTVLYGYVGTRIFFEI